MSVAILSESGRDLGQTRAEELPLLFAHYATNFRDAKPSAILDSMAYESPGRAWARFLSWSQTRRP